MGGGGGRALKPKQYARLSNGVNKKSNDLHNVSMWYNQYFKKCHNFLSTNPTFFGGGGGGGEGGGGRRWRGRRVSTA